MPLCVLVFIYFLEIKGNHYTKCVYGKSLYEKKNRKFRAGENSSKWQFRHGGIQASENSDKLNSGKWDIADCI